MSFTSTISSILLSQNPKTSRAPGASRSLPENRPLPKLAEWANHSVNFHTKDQMGGHHFAYPCAGMIALRYTDHKAIITPGRSTASLSFHLVSATIQASLISSLAHASFLPSHISYTRHVPIRHSVLLDPHLQGWCDGWRPVMVELGLFRTDESRTARVASGRRPYLLLEWYLVLD